jgi:rRNA maturation endonuclease Nob1
MTEEKNIEFYDLPEHREDLKKYFKVIIICNTCGKEFGIDNKTSVDICPVCELKLTRKTTNGKG